jgi:crotonobetainyl-CoA:carnitine CoA-transferase CaiB-like acyl-CoA transferase
VTGQREGGELLTVSLFRGVRVLDLSRMLAGPYGSMLMADLGAEVIKIEDPDGGDPMRRMGPPFLANGESAYFLSVNRSKKSVALDLTLPSGREAFLDLVRIADVVWDNFRPGTMEKLGCPYSRLQAVNPRIIACSLSAFGQQGPYADRPAFDLALQAIGGAMSLTGEEGRAPARMGLPMGDLAGGIFGAFAVAGALFRRERTGQGSHIDLSLLDCQVSLLSYVAQYFWADGKVPGPMGSGHTSVVPYQALAARDGYLVVAAFTEKFWSGFCRAIGRPDLEQDPRFESNIQRVANRAALVPILQGILMERGVGDWLDALRREGVPAAPINSVDQVLSDPQVRHRKMVVEMVHPRLGPLPTLGTPIKVDEAMGLEVKPAPLLGEHTDEVLGGLLNYTLERLRALRAEKAAA